ncbi:uncharacterized protein N7518_003622 [Penicillium psychrosexuale]|uniref:uncharacterized protein n=1 Tax=Penicillium psychrosexuale TaxID=1002107 RepID=UPI00254534BF|nr:uncharacterized protein N7518_003622 [Penicillium psychrosexuale]KAJ5801554.1 hypothetical protein N7518_003622 [Penicillium psychrosexuale]
MQIIKVTLFLCAAMGTVATPIDSVSDGLDARAESSALRDYNGVCFRAKNECRYKNDREKTSYVKCSSTIANNRPGNP